MAVERFLVPWLEPKDPIFTGQEESPQRTEQSHVAFRTKAMG
jgi:hypothetical protein